MGGTLLPVNTLLLANMAGLSFRFNLGLNFSRTLALEVDLKIKRSCKKGIIGTIFAIYNTTTFIDFCQVLKVKKTGRGYMKLPPKGIWPISA